MQGNITCNGGIVHKVYGGRRTETAWKRLFERYMEAFRTAYNSDKDSLCFADKCFEVFTAHQLMGHGEYDVTAKIYTHVDEQSKNSPNCFLYAPHPLGVQALLLLYFSKTKNHPIGWFRVYGFSQLREERPKQTTTRYAGGE